MGIQDYIIIGIVALIVVGIVVYLIRAKKRGQKCIGCPYASSCERQKTCTCGDKKDGEDKA